MHITQMSGACEYIPQKGSIQEESNGKLSEKQKDVVRLSGIIAVAIFIAWLNVLPYNWLSNVIVVGAVLVGGFPIYKESFGALKKGRINMELSMVIAIFASLLLFQFLPAIVITFFALMSEFIEGYIVQKGRKNIQLLYNRAPKKALIMENTLSQENLKEKSFYELSLTKEVSVEEVKIGDMVVVREGDTIPVDGHILEGSSTLDQSTITGESMPADKNVGDFVYAGTLNITNRLLIKSEKISKETVFAKIIHLVEESESKKAPIQKLSDKMATRLVQFSICLSVLTFLITQDLVDTLSVIVVAGACGLAVGTPIALLASNSRLARNGLIVKGGIQLENISKAGTIVFDKTGTLTTGKLVVTKIIPIAKNITASKILEYAAIAERDVNHPIAKAIAGKAVSESITIMKYSGSKDKISDIAPQILTENKSSNRVVRVGKGVSVVYDNYKISVGNIQFIKEQFGPSYDSNSDLLQKTIASSSISTNVVVVLNNEIIGIIFLDDQLRNDAKQAITQIRSMGLYTVMLTGDNQNIATDIAKKTGIDECHANLLPEDKVYRIKEIVSRYKNNESKGTRETVIMVGDGVNDAPAMAEADVGIAMGKTGTDIAIDTADVILMTESLIKIPQLIKSSRSTMFTIKQNFFGTLLIDGLGFVLAFAGLLNPLLAAFIHIGSELIFIANSARLVKGS